MTPHAKRRISPALTALTLCMVAICSTAPADTPPAVPPAPTPAAPVAVAVVDMEAVVRGTQAGRAMLGELEGLVNQKRLELETVNTEAKAIRAKAVELAPAASQKQLTDLQRQYDEKIADLRRLQNEVNQEVNQRRLALLADFHKRVLPVIEGLGRERGYAMIWRKGEAGMLYADSRVDLTDQVIQRVNTP